jgi:large subunit ribosomal protein L29
MKSGMQVGEFRDMAPSERKLKLESLKEELFKLRVQLSTGQLQNTCSIKRVKKEIARCMTVERELAG